jgi:diguanylate cyclase (GGDEF)-like protein
MHDLNDILERLQHNEEIALRFFEVEVSILSILNFKDLLERLLTEIREKFEIPYVWISLIDENDLAHLIRTLASSDVLRKRLNVIKKETFLALVGNDARPLLINNDLSPFYALFPQNENYLIRSLAMSPITLGGEIIGSLNYGDSSAIRYTPGMDTTFLERLAVKVSICLSNVTAHEKMRLAASRDPLTGLLNRRVMESVLNREFRRAVRYKSPLSVVFLDLDDFKGVNDRYGHDVGDDLLKYVADHLVGLSRDSDVAARYAGDEFVLILPSTEMEEALTLSERLADFLLKNPLRESGTQIPIHVSFGAAHIRDSRVRDAASLLKTADEMLYEKKKTKKAGRILPLER